MRNKVAVILNHQLTQEQLRELSKKYRRVVYLPDELRARFAQVEPETAKETAKAVVDWLKKESPDAAVVQGHPDVVAMIVLWCTQTAVKPLYAHTRREVVEVKQDDGSVKKTSVFKHLGFVEYAFSEVVSNWVKRFCFEGDRSAKPLD